MKTNKINFRGLNKYGKYLFWLGPIFIVMGITAAVVSGTWDNIPLGLIITGAVISGLWLIFLEYIEQGFWGRRSTKAGTNAIASTLVVLVILGLVNFLTLRDPFHLDLTDNQQLSLAPLSQQLVTNLPQPAKVWIFQSTIPPQLQELLANYQRLNPQKFSFELVDPQVSPALAHQNFDVKDVGDVYLEYNQKRQFLGSLKSQSISEAKLTSGLEQLISGRQIKIYFLSGHGERSFTSGEGGFAQAVNSLKEKNYLVETLNLAGTTAEVPQDTAVVVVAGPKQSLFPEEVKALNNYLNHGGGVLLMLDPNTKPGLESLFKDWGIQLDERIAIDPTKWVKGFGMSAPLVNTYGDHPITKAFGKDYSLFPSARPIYFIPAPGIKATPLLFTSPQSWATSNLKQGPKWEFNSQQDVKGPLVLGLALSRNLTKSESNQGNQLNQKVPESRLVILGNSAFATDGLFGGRLNGDVLINSATWLSQEDDQFLSIRPREAPNRRLNLTPPQVKIIWWCAIVIFPLLGFGAAGLLWWYRR